MKKIILAIIAFTTLFSLASCKKDKCKAHVDADDDLLCDLCGEEFDDGEEAVIPETLECTFTVKTPEGQTLSGIKVTLKSTSKTVEFTSGTDGTAKCALLPGSYSVNYDYATLPSGFLPETTAVKIDKQTTLTLIVVDNNPDGSAKKPFVISENDTPFTIGAGEVIYYNYHGSTNRKIVIESDKLAVTYNGNEYTANDGVITIQLSSDIGVATNFSIKNISSDTVSATIELIAPLGSLDNPITLEESSASVNVPEEAVIHYVWTADKTGILVLTSASEKNNIGITKTIKNDVPISSQTLGTGVAYMPVAVGDLITLAVSSTAKSDSVIDFTITTYAGDANEPVPVLKSAIDVSFAENAQITFTKGSYTSLTIIDDQTNVICGDVTHTPDSYGFIEIDLTGEIFTVKNMANEVHSIEIEFK